jgi:hypothetical protein
LIASPVVSLCVVIVRQVRPAAEIKKGKPCGFPHLSNLLVAVG